VATLLLVLLLCPGDPPTLQRQALDQQYAAAGGDTMPTTNDSSDLRLASDGAWPAVPSVPSVGEPGAVPAAAHGWFSWATSSPGGITVASAQLEEVFIVVDAALSEQLKKLKWGRGGNFAGFTVSL
jgi:hypothetical protein